MNRLNPRDASYSAINSSFHQITEGLHVVVGKAGGGELFFRVRRTNGSRPTFVSELQAPPAHLVRGYQRCNPPEVPMFYASSKRIGALIEARVQAGETVYLSQWIGRDQIPVNRVFDSEENQTVPGVDQSTIHGPNDDLVMTYLDTQFTKRIHPTFSDDYKFTSAIAQQLTSNFPENDFHDVRKDGHVALKYPSVFALEDCHNTAMHANFASERLELLHVMEANVQSVDGDTVSIAILDNAINFPDGRIEWLGDIKQVPALRPENRAVPFRFNGQQWKLELHDGDVTSAYVDALINE